MTTEIKEQEIAKYHIGSDSEYINKELGIRKIKLFQPTAKQLVYGIVTTMWVDSGIGEVKITVFESKENPGQLYLRGPKSKGVVDGEVKYFDELKINKAAADFLLSFLENYIEKESVERVKLR